MPPPLNNTYKYVLLKNSLSMLLYDTIIDINKNKKQAIFQL